MIAALYVEKGGVYYGLPDVDPWDEERDARLYAGPWPVVAHPPCNRWSVMALVRPHLIGQDGGTFRAALDAVRTFGGVLEHPAFTLAWRHFGLPRPCVTAGWTQVLDDPGMVCQVDQSFYGHTMRKLTWLYYCGQSPPGLLWGDGGKQSLSVESVSGFGESGKRRSRTPPAFRDVLLNMARSAQPLSEAERIEAQG